MYSRQAPERTTVHRPTQSTACATSTTTPPTLTAEGDQSYMYMYMYNVCLAHATSNIDTVMHLYASIILYTMYINGAIESALHYVEEWGSVFMVIYTNTHAHTHTHTHTNTGGSSEGVSDTRAAGIDVPAPGKQLVHLCQFNHSQDSTRGLHASGQSLSGSL